MLLWALTVVGAAGDHHRPSTVASSGRRRSTAVDGSCHGGAVTRPPSAPQPAGGGVAGGGRHVLLRLLGGAMLSFGNGHASRLGHGDEEHQPRPKPVAALSAKQVKRTPAGRLAPNKQRGLPPTADPTGTNEQAVRLQSARTRARTEEERGATESAHGPSTAPHLARTSARTDVAHLRALGPGADFESSRHLRIAMKPEKGTTTREGKTEGNTDGRRRPLPPRQRRQKRRGREGHGETEQENRTTTGPTTTGPSNRKWWRRLETPSASERLAGSCNCLLSTQFRLGWAHQRGPCRARLCSRQGDSAPAQNVSATARTLGNVDATSLTCDQRLSRSGDGNFWPTGFQVQVGGACGDGPSRSVNKLTSRSNKAPSEEFGETP